MLALAGAGMLAVRLAVVATTADVDTDAYGHFAIARALLHEPANLSVHWVWLPGYHYLVWALLFVTAVGLGPFGKELQGLGDCLVEGRQGGLVPVLDPCREAFQEVRHLSPRLRR